MELAAFAPHARQGSSRPDDSGKIDMIPLRLGISTCPNDTYIYEALISGLENSPFKWSVTFADVQTLNEMVLQGRLDVAKVSCGVLPLVQSDYRLLSCGGAMGFGCGPLLLSSRKGQLFAPDEETILPGKNTTAALLFRFWASEAHGISHPKVSYAFFDEVYSSLCSDRKKQGVVIHEKRFTWSDDNLGLLTDLGAFWESRTRSPIPLGCAVAKKSLGEEAILAVEQEIRESLELAHSRKKLVSDFIRSKAKITDDSVIERHIRLFVSDFTREIGNSGRKALEVLSQHVFL